jgi:FKBP-type peptidyl-prolyl cis-trans isomerase
MERKIGMRLALGLIGVALLGSACGPQPAGQGAAPQGLASLENEVQRYSYALGMDVGNYLRAQPGDIDVAAFWQGLDDAHAQRSTLLDPDEAQQLKQVEGRRRSEAQAKESEEQGKMHLKTNADKPGVVQTASGLQIETLVEGQGPSPQASDEVTVHYTGTLIDGTQFDSSRERGEPASFPLNGVIAGWTEGLQLMKVGGRALLTIPPDLGYGAQGAGGVIPPNSVLIFDVELLSID